MKLIKTLMTLVIASSSVLVNKPSLAGTFPDGTLFFDKAPDLLDVYTTMNQIRVWNAKYYFIINVPPTAGASLGKVLIQQRVGQEDVELLPNKTLVFMGTPDDRGVPLPASFEQDTSTDTITITLKSPVPPGSTFTIGLIPDKNPQYGGAYIFGVTAFPPEKSRGIYLGVGRLQFYDSFPH